MLRRLFRFLPLKSSADLNLPADHMIHAKKNLPGTTKRHQSLKEVGGEAAASNSKGDRSRARESLL
jgi:hypothetical protein